jgi:hypothetical protein
MSYEETHGDMLKFSGEFSCWLSKKTDEFNEMVSIHKSSAQKLRSKIHSIESEIEELNSEDKNLLASNKHKIHVSF